MPACSVCERTGVPTRACSGCGEDYCKHHYPPPRHECPAVAD